MATNWKQWLGNGKCRIVGKLGGIQKNKWQWRLLNVDGQNCTYCEPKPGAKLNTFCLAGAQVRMVDSKSQMHRNFCAMKIEGVHPQKKEIKDRVFIAVLMPVKDSKFVFMVEEADSKNWMLVLNQKEFPRPVTIASLAAAVPPPSKVPATTPVQPKPVVAQPVVQPVVAQPVTMTKPAVVNMAPPVQANVAVQQPRFTTPTPNGAAHAAHTAHQVQGNFNQMGNQQQPQYYGQQNGEFYEEGEYQGEYGEEFEGEYPGEFEGEYGEEFEGEYGEEFEGEFEGEYEGEMEGEYPMEGEFPAEYGEGEEWQNEQFEGEYEGEAQAMTEQFGQMHLQAEGEYPAEGEYYPAGEEGEYYGEEEGEYYGEEGEYYGNEGY